MGEHLEKAEDKSIRAAAAANSRSSEMMQQDRPVLLGKQGTDL